ncbi:acyltransferase [Oerskovia sp. M15]
MTEHQTESSVPGGLPPGQGDAPRTPLCRRPRASTGSTPRRPLRSCWWSSITWATSMRRCSCRSRSPLNEAWRQLNNQLIPVRMPLFFLVSGMLATRAVARPWRAVRRPRVADILWPFVLWSLVYGAATGAAYATDPGGWAGAAFVNWAAIPLGGTAYWYLSALVVFFCTAWLGRRFGAILVLVAFTAWLAASSMTPLLSPVLGVSLTTNVVRWCYFGLWYMVGCFARDIVARIANLPLLPTFGVSACLYVLVARKVYGGEEATTDTGSKVSTCSGSCRRSC